MSKVKFNLMLPYILGLAGNIALVFYMLSMWIEPAQYSVGTIVDTTMLLAMEFFLVHAGNFTSGIKSKSFLFCLFLFYGTFIVFLSASINGHTLLYIYGSIVAVRLWQPGTREVDLETNEISYSSLPEAAGRTFFFMLSLSLIHI